MVEVAVFDDQHHQQFSCSASSFTLRKSESSTAHWMLDENPTEEQIDAAFQIEISPDGASINGGNVFELPYIYYQDSTWIEITAPSTEEKLVPLRDSDWSGDFSHQDTKKYSGPSAATVTKWLTQAGELHRSTAGSPQFYHDAARFAVETVGLDSAFVLQRYKNKEQEDWQIAGSYLTSPQQGVSFDSGILDQLHHRQVAWYQPASKLTKRTRSIVIAPICDSEGKLIGAIYGIRHHSGQSRRQGIRPLEARLIQLLADSVSVGIARLHQETEAAKARVLLEQTFSPSLAQYIQQHPDCLLGQEREVTLLFADLRGYTSLAESLEPADCYELLGDVMESLTQEVLRKQGVVVDYYGDGLLALWNAPQEQPNHADLACSAAIDMFDAIPSLEKKWSQLLSRPLELGIGIHSGPAHVGNAGTRSRLKYGARGNTVNVASRVQSASKQLQLPLVITAATQTKLSTKFFTLRACTAKLPGLEQPTELYTVFPAAKAAKVKSRLDDYTRALDLFESGDLESAEELLGDLVDSGRVTPAQFLAHYTAAMKNKNLGRRAVDKYAAGSGPVIEILAK